MVTLDSLNKTTMVTTGTKKKITCTKHDLKFDSTCTVVLGREMWTKCPKCHAEYDQSLKEDAPKIPWLSKRREGMTLSSFNIINDKSQAIFNRISSYAQNFEKVKEQGSSLCFIGSPGTGKTHLAVGLGVSIHNSGYSVTYQRLYELMRRIKSTYSKSSTETEEEIINRLFDFDLLILDEVGLKKLSETESALTYEIIDQRYEGMKPTILISNLNEDELSDNLGSRTIDRMYENHGAVFVFNWESYRRK